MEPAGKRRKLAPKLNASISPLSDSHATPYHHHHSLPQPQPSHIVPDAPHHSQRQEFEAYARHLHDAAILISHQHQNQKTRYLDASVLLLSWQDDVSASDNIHSLQHVFESEYHYRTQSWQIPTVSNPSIKLGVQMATFLEHARPNQLLIIYYSGNGFISSDGQLYWTCSAQDDSARLKWDVVRCLFEDAHSDILLLLDTCSAPDSVTSSHGVKQVIAAYSPDQPRYTWPSTPSYFTPCLVDALHKLRSTAPFSTQRLCNEMAAATASSPSKPAPRMSPPIYSPKFYIMTPDKSKTIELAPLSDSPAAVMQEPICTNLKSCPLSPEVDSKLTFDEARILVCTTFIGDANPDMAAFNCWLQNTPPLAAQVTVEGMFLGPPTVLLISMPTPLWQSVQHDKIWFCLGTITSRNMISQYNKLVGQAGLPRRSMDALSSTSSVMTTTFANGLASRRESYPQRSYNAQSTRDANSDHQTSPTARLFQSLTAGSLELKPKAEVADSAEMQEAAEQLKALSHVRHGSGDAGPGSSPTRASLPDTLPSLHPGFRTLTRSESTPVLEGASASSTATRIRRVLGKPEIRCAHCSHAPFKDSSSLRKHIAAAHTRPFPCAFHFSGCLSTFGSKNEWKRHIASQHLCLQYYRCKVCAQTAADGKGNEFNRKDLFTQHLRRMHAPPQVKRALAKGDAGPQSEWDDYVKEMQQVCLVQRRHPPQRSNCPKPGCTSKFEGPAAWDEWTEHVGRHMEKGEGDDLEVDELLRQYALDEGIIEPSNNNKYRLCSAASVAAANQAASQPENPPASHRMSQPESLSIPESHNVQTTPIKNSLPTQNNSHPWGPRSLPPLPAHPLHSAPDRTSS